MIVSVSFVKMHEGAVDKLEIQSVHAGGRTSHICAPSLISCPSRICHLDRLAPSFPPLPIAYTISKKHKR